MGGRKLWGALIANTRHLSRDSHFLPAKDRQVLLYQMLMFVATLRDRLRGRPIHRAQFAYTQIDEAHLDWLDNQINAPQRVLESMQQQLIDAVKQGHISDIIYMSIQKHVIEMGNIKVAVIAFMAHHYHFRIRRCCIARCIVFVGCCHLAYSR